MQNNNWTSDWPTEPGNYWFHGWLHKCSYDSKPKTCLVKAFNLGPTLALVAEGSFIYRRDGAKGLWLPAEVPEPSEFNLEGKE